MHARRTATTVTFALGLVLTLMPGSAQAHHLPGSEPTKPYPQPAPFAPMRGCQAFPADPKSPAGTPNAVQVIYAYRTDAGSPGYHYEETFEQIARIVDRIDWSLDESSDYDQHVNLSCRYTPDTSYRDYARALVVPEQIERGSALFTSADDVRADIAAAGYDDPNRWYLVMTDFESDSNSNLCNGSGGCGAVVELFDSGVAGHELLHAFGAGHAWRGELPGPGNALYGPDIMQDWWDWWQADDDYNTYYDPSERTASFYFDPLPSTGKWNIANSPALTVPVCCDLGAANDLLTAAERTMESGTVGGTAPGMTSVGAAVLSTTAECGTTGVSCKFNDGRKSLSVRSGTAAVSGVAVGRRPAVVAGRTYAFKAMLRSDVARRVRLRLRWFNSVGTLLLENSSADITLATAWTESTLTARAPTGATTVELHVTTPVLQTTFTYHVDSLRLSYSQADGFPDLLDFASGAWTRLRNNGTGVFTQNGAAVSGLTKPDLVVPLDVDTDGYLDLLHFETANAGSWVKIRNTGSGTFAWNGYAVQNRVKPAAAVALDYNNDGYKDLLAFESGSWVRFRNNRNATFTVDGTAVTGLTTPDTALVLDYNGDGRDDLLVFEAPNQGSWVRLKNLGDGRFAHDGFAVRGLARPEKAVLLDYDRDGKRDILYYEPTNNGSWTKLRNNGGGVITHEGFAVSGMSRPDAVAVLDYDRDGWEDLLDFEPTGSWVRLRNQRNGTMTWSGVAASGLPRPDHALVVDLG